MESIVNINKRLLDEYGRGLADKQLFRVVWAASQREMRRGTFEKTTEAGLYLGTETCVRDCEKYPLWPDMWVLEMIQPNDCNPELIDRTSYEPLYVFKDKNSNPLPVDWEVIEKICYYRIHGTVKVKTQRDIDAIEEERIGQETELTLDYLRHNKPFPKKMYDSAVVSVPSNYKE